MLRASLLVLALAFVPCAVASAQCNPLNDLQVDISPPLASQGQLITVTVTNVSSSCLYKVYANRLFLFVLDGDCNGAPVASFFGPLVLVDLPPGAKASKSWDQSNFSGMPLPNGPYAFALAVFDDTGTQVTLPCPIVNIGPVCPIPPQNYGAPTAGTGGIAPVLGTLGDLPLLGNSQFQLFVVNGRGAAPMVLFLGAGQASIPAPFGTFLLDPNLPLIPIATSLGGAAGAAGAGSIAIPAPIPNSPALLGAQVYLQALIGDPEAQGGVAQTSGLTFAICQ